MSEGESTACVLRGLSAGLDGGVKVLSIRGRSKCPGAWWADDSFGRTSGES